MQKSLASLLSIPFDIPNDLTVVEHEGEYWLSAAQIGTHLGYAQPSQAIAKLFTRNEADLAPYSKLIDVRTLGGQPDTQFGYGYGTPDTQNDHDASRPCPVRFFNEEGVYLLTMLARTDKAAEFRARVARLLKEIRTRRMEIAMHEAATAARKEITAGIMQISPERFPAMRKAVSYRNKGLSTKETAKLMDIAPRTVYDLMRDARRLGMEVAHE